MKIQITTAALLTLEHRPQASPVPHAGCSQLGEPHYKVITNQETSASRAWKDLVSGRLCHLICKVCLSPILIRKKIN